MIRLLFTIAFAFAVSAQATPTDSVYQLADTYTDQTGHDFKLSERQGRPQVVALFYSTCRFACPLIVNSINAVSRALDDAERGKLGLMLVSFDPERDSVQRLAEVAKERGLDGRWTLARADADAVRKLAAVFNVRYRQRDDGEFDHANVLVLLDAEGRIKARTDKIGAVPDPAFMAKVRVEVAATAP